MVYIKKKKQYHKTCPTCKKAFITSVHNKLNCGDICRDIYEKKYREENKESIAKLARQWRYKNRHRINARKNHLMREREGQEEKKKIENPINRSKRLSGIELNKGLIN